MKDGSDVFGENSLAVSSPQTNKTESKKHPSLPKEVITVAYSTISLAHSSVPCLCVRFVSIIYKKPTFKIFTVQCNNLLHSLGSVPAVVGDHAS